MESVLRVKARLLYKGVNSNKGKSVLGSPDDRYLMS